MKPNKTKANMEAVLIDRDAATRRTLQSYLTGQGIRVAGQANDLSSGLHLIRSLRQGILIIELAANATETLEAVRRIRVDLPQLGIIVTAKEVSPDLILRSIRAGANEFLARPLEIRELGEAIGRLATLAPAANPIAGGGKIITLFSAKGGLGVTSVAANLAIALAKRDAKTVLVDLDLQMGDASLLLDLKPSHTWAETMHGNSLDVPKMRTLLAKHDCGLSLLPSPTRLDAADELTAIKVGEVLSLLQSMFEYVVVDAGRSFDPRPLEALNLADVVLLVGVPTVPAARNLRLSIEMLGELGLPPERLRLIMNRHQKRSGVNSRELEETIGLPISWQIPADDRVMTEAINAGVPPVLGASRSEIARSFVHLAEEIAALQIEAPPKSTSKAA